MGYAWYIGKRFCKSTSVFFDNLSRRIQLWCRKLLVFDKERSREEIDEMRRDPKIYHHVCRGGEWEQMRNDGRESYDEHKAAMQSMKDDDHPALHNTEREFLKEFGHLFETVKRGFSHVQTRYEVVKTTCVSKAPSWLRTRS